MPILLRRLGEIGPRYTIVFVDGPEDDGVTDTEEDENGKELKFASEEDARQFINENIVANTDYLPEYRDGKKWFVRPLDNDAESLINAILSTLGINV